MRIRVSLLIAVLASLVLAAMAFWWAPLNQDEGWYLMAARRVSQGKMPYRDFAFTQAPLFPYVFQIAQPLVKTFGLAGGRLFQFFWFGMTFWVLLWNCRTNGSKKAYPFAALLVICLLGLNAFQLQYTATVKTYTLAGYFLSLSMLGWLTYQRNPRPATLILCALALAAATATRLSLGLFFVPLGLSLMAKRQTVSDRPWILFALAGFLGLACFFGPFLLLAPEGMKFGLLDFHANRQVDAPLLLKTGFLSRVTQSFFPAVVALLCLLRSWRSWQPGLRAMGLGIGAVSILHLLAPLPYDDYQVALYPTLVLLIALQASHQLAESTQRQTAPLILITGLLFAFSSPQLPSWFSNGQDRIWWKSKPQSDLQLLQQTAERITHNHPDVHEIFTTETTLAIETGWEMPARMEMGPFSYFPDMDTATAEKRQVLNHAYLVDLIQNTEAPMAAFSGYSFAIQSPWITPTPLEQVQSYYELLSKRYVPLTQIENFGQGPTTLVLYQRRPGVK